jgi:hypothetical protein
MKTLIEKRAAAAHEGILGQIGICSAKATEEFGIFPYFILHHSTGE